jgi:uncharacterized membrane protein
MVLKSNSALQHRAPHVSSKDIALVAVFAALYAIAVYLFSPISFYAVQFRIAGALRPAIAKKWALTIGYATGVVIGNMFSPFVGPLELGFMPVMALVAGIVGYVTARRFNHNYWIAGAVIAAIIAPSISLMFYLLFNLAIVATLPYLLLSEETVCFIGAYTFRMIERRVKLWS